MNKIYTRDLQNNKESGYGLADLDMLTILYKINRMFHITWEVG